MRLDLNSTRALRDGRRFAGFRVDARKCHRVRRRESCLPGSPFARSRKRKRFLKPRFRAHMDTPISLEGTPLGSLEFDASFVHLDLPGRLLQRFLMSEDAWMSPDREDFRRQQRRSIREQTSLTCTP